MTGPAFLLDVNVLLALAWPNHQFHKAAHRWFENEAEAGWATCAVTELGFVRLSANPAYTPAAVTATAAAQLLARICADPGHHSLACPPMATVDLRQVRGHKQVTDAYLLSLASALGCRLVSFDKRLEALASEAELLVLSP